MAAYPAQKEREGDVLLGCELRDELAELEDEAETVSPEPASLLLAHAWMRCPSKITRPDAGDQDAGEAVEQRDLPIRSGP